MQGEEHITMQRASGGVNNMYRFVILSACCVIVLVFMVFGKDGSSIESNVGQVYEMTAEVVSNVRNGGYDNYTPSKFRKEGAMNAVANKKQEFDILKTEMVREGKGLCEDPDFTKVTLKEVYNAPIAALLWGKAKQGENRFEASDIAHVENKYYVVFDNLQSIGIFGENLILSDPSNKLVLLPPDGDNKMSGFEGITWDEYQRKAYVVVENVPYKDTFRPVVKEYGIKSELDQPLLLRRACYVEVNLQFENKGLEGVQHLRRGKVDYLLGLCEGNHCMGGAKGRDRGNGRILVMRKEGEADNLNDCTWKFFTLIPLPESVKFVDYSAIHVEHGTLRVAVTSQESSAVWIGKLSETEWKFVDEGKIYHFPRGENCAVNYCNVEGVRLIGPHELIAVSDKMKGGGAQPSSCFAKDQSISLFILPD